MTSSLPWHLVIACRDMGSAGTAVKNLLKASARGARVEVMAKAPFGSAVPVPAWNSTAALAKGELGLAATNDDENADRGIQRPS